MFENGEIVKVVLTGDYGMVIDVLRPKTRPGYVKGYLVRLEDYSTRKFYEFELAKREMYLPTESELAETRFREQMLKEM